MEDGIGLFRGLGMYIGQARRGLLKLSAGLRQRFQRRTGRLSVAADTGTLKL